ncbi:MAG: response regulator [Proteobacteria bacterium]|nr:response regulator [Pseudomonadota bacterium]
MAKTVLIVEDNDLNMKLFSHLLSVRGYSTLHARDGRDALILARTHRPDLILMDIELPEVSGLEVTQRLKQDSELKDIPVVAVTAFAMLKGERMASQGGCDAFLSKPISAKLFWGTLDRFLN